jgi:aspartate carbamoyltransferase regulatory subunit
MESKREKTVLEVPAIENGTVIDHIPAGATLTVVGFFPELRDLVTIGINLPSPKIGRKGVVKIANRKLSADEVAKIALVAPTATLNIIENYRVVQKSTIKPPAIAEGIMRCGNPNCITNHEPVRTRFAIGYGRDGRLRFTCHYCERAYRESEIEIISDHAPTVL